jgi:putative SOS response-associated peptidase YedK
MCYSNSSTSKNIDLSKRYKKEIPDHLNESPIYMQSGFAFSQWRVISSSAHILPMNWGLVPTWFNGTDPHEIAKLTLNARVESAAEKPSFKNLVARNRCIIPSTGFFEWKLNGKSKIPYFIYPTNDSVFSMAGLYDTWMEAQTGKIINTFSILTCEANPLMAEIHNTKKRMPCILKSEFESDWLKGLLPLEQLYVPFPQEFMNVHEVQKTILMSADSNRPEVQLPAFNESYEQGTLF